MVLSSLIKWDTDYCDMELLKDSQSCIKILEPIPFNALRITIIFASNFGEQFSASEKAFKREIGEKF